jgi:hypothetical protein
MTRKIILPFGLLLILLTACSGLVGRSGQVIDATNTPVPDSKMLGTFYPINGTHYQMAAIIDAPGSSRNSGSDYSQLFTSRRYDYGVYNYVFLDVNAEKVHALLPHNSNIIQSVRGYPTPVSTADDVPPPPVSWWLYTIQSDTDKDGKLTSEDLKTLSMSDVGGLGYTELIHDVERVLAEVYRDNNTLLVLYHSKDKNFMASIDLTTGKVIKTSELPSFGEDVQ